MAWRADPGTDLVLNVHMRPTGKPELVQPSIGLYFTGEPGTKYPMLLPLEHDGALDIPPGDADFLVSDDFVMPMDMDVLAVYPHAHYLGHLLEGYATLPDGTRKWLIRIPDWDPSWQAVYRYKEPVFLPKGTVVSMRYHYDNSAANVRNPNQPPQRVRDGNQATDEMAHLSLQVLPRGAAGPPHGAAGSHHAPSPGEVSGGFHGAVQPGHAHAWARPQRRRRPLLARRGRGAAGSSGGVEHARRGAGFGGKRERGGRILRAGARRRIRAIPTRATTWPTRSSNNSAGNRRRPSSAKSSPTIRTTRERGSNWARCCGCWATRVPRRAVSKRRPRTGASRCSSGRTTRCCTAILVPCWPVSAVSGKPCRNSKPRCASIRNWRRLSAIWTLPSHNWTRSSTEAWRPPTRRKFPDPA